MRKMLDYFKDMEDYRQAWKVKHQLTEIIVIIICAVVSGAENIAEIALYAKCKEMWLRSILVLENGLPSQDTIERFMRHMDPKEFKRSFLHWVRSVAKVTNGEIVPIDGKALRGSRDGEKKAIYMVSAWARTNGIVLAQEKVADKSNEITAIPELLKVLEIKGCIVTIDAMGCQKDIAKQIKEKGAEYVLALKGNQKNLFDDVQLFLDDCIADSFKGVSFDKHYELDKGHGRIETRTYYITDDISWLAEQDKWAGLRSVGVTISTRELKGIKTEQRRYHICSIAPDAEKYAEAVRGHWSIENNLHWILDVVMCEDEARNRKDNSAENMAIIRHLALNLMSNDPSVKLSKKQMKKKLEWDHDYAMSLVFGDIQFTPNR
jgi:predicted transposase YbfD/YdcC